MVNRRAVPSDTDELSPGDGIWNHFRVWNPESIHIERMFEKV